eukprot:jgi/Botrbrau1/21856/Bobra.0190s0067.2
MSIEASLSIMPECSSPRRQGRSTCSQLTLRERLPLGQPMGFQETRPLPRWKSVKAQIWRYGQEGNIDAALRFFHTSLDLHALADHAHDLYVATIGACVKCQEADAAIGLLRAMQRKNVPLGLKPYNLVVLALSLCGRATEGFHILQEMIQHGLEPTTFTYVCILNCCSLRPTEFFQLACQVFATFTTRQQTLLVFTVFKDMIVNGQLPDTETFQLLIRSCIAGQKVEKAFEVFEWLVGGRWTNSPLPTNREMFQLLIKGCHQRGWLEKALEVAAWMDSAGLQLDPGTCRELASTVDTAVLWDKKALDTAKRVGLTEGVPPDLLREGPYSGMRAIYQQNWVDRQEEAILAGARLGYRGWAPVELRPPPSAK